MIKNTRQQFLLVTLLCTAMLICSCTCSEPPSPTPAGLRTRFADDMVMAYVPAGEFTMGSTDAEVDDALALCKKHRDTCERAGFELELPAHTVTLDAFWIDRTEVTNAHYAAFLNEEGNQEEGGAPWLAVDSEDTLIEQVEGAYQAKSGYADHPVINVSWYGAAAYCEWAGGQLPTEAQWEYAARGSEGNIFPWGNKVDKTRLNYCDERCTMSWADESFDDGFTTTAPAGSYPEGASWCGAFDLAGNVWEMVGDWYGKYDPEQGENPTGADAGEYRVIRGGAWNTALDDVRAANRGYVDPIPSDGQAIGFRCATLGE